MRCTTWLASLALIVLSVSAASAEGASVRLVVRSNKPAIAPFEPVIVTYAVENVSKELQDVPALTDIALGWVKIEISDETGTFRPYRSGVQGIAMLKFVALKPRERLSDQVIVLTNAYGRAARSNPTEFGDVPVFPFGTPGHYKVRVTFPLEPRSASNSRRQLVEVIPITVKQSRGASEDLKRFANVDDLAAAVGADANDIDLTEAVPRWDRIVQSAPNSVFAPFVEFNLGRSYQNGIGTASPDDGRAAAHFWAVVTGGPPELADDALIGFAEAQIELGNYKEATNALDRVLSEYGAENMARRATRLRDGLASGKRSLNDIQSE